MASSIIRHTVFNKHKDKDKEKNGPEVPPRTPLPTTETAWFRSPNKIQPRSRKIVYSY